MHAKRRRTLLLFALALTVLLAAYEVAQAQYGGFGGYGQGFGGGFGRGGRGMRGGRYTTLPERDIFPGSTFTFCRIQYDSTYGKPGGGWSTDYPSSDINFSRRLGEMTTININHTADGEIQHAVVRLTDPDLFHYPFTYMDEVGPMTLSEPEQEALRSYLFRGGFLMVDDFWGDVEWDNLQQQMAQVLDPKEYPIVDIPLSHQIFHIVFDIKQVPQVPGVAMWERTGLDWETDHDYSETGDHGPHARGIFDKQGRLMVFIMHNCDMGDGWEEENTDEEYFIQYSAKRAYPLGINAVVYAMTH